MVLRNRVQSKAVKVCFFLFFFHLSQIAEAQPNRINQVEVHQHKGRSVVTIAGSARPSYSISTLASPERLVVDVSNAQFEGLGSRIDAETEQLTGVSLSERTVRGQRRSRVVLHLRGEVAYRARIRGNNLIVSLLGSPQPRLNLEKGQREVVERFRQVCQDLETDRNISVQDSNKGNNNAQIRRLKSEITALERQLAKAQKQAQKLRIETKRARRELEKVRGHLKKSQWARKLAEEQLGLSERSLKKLARRVSKLDNECGEEPIKATRVVMNARPEPQKTVEKNRKLPRGSGNPRRLFHTVQPGEFLVKIAHQYGVSLNELIYWNKGINADRIVAGQRILILGQHPLIHHVGEGEEIPVIAQRYGVTTEDLIRWNQGVDPESLSVGRTLMVYPSRKRR